MPGRIAKGTLNLLAGESAVGKTFLALDLALGVAARGLAWGGLEIPRGRVLYLCLDASPVTLSRHMIGLCRQYAIEPPADLLFDFDRHDLSDPREIAFITSQVAERGLSLVILDVLARYLDALNENTAATISRLMISLRRVASDSGASFLFIHHFNKQRSTRTTVGERVRGSSDLIASMDGVLSATRRVGRMDLRPVKNRLGVDAAPLSYRISAQQDGSPCLEFIADDTQPDLAETIVEVAREQVVRMLRILHGHFYPRTAIEEMLAAWGQIDILVNNAGGGIPEKPIEDATEADFDLVLDLNVKSTFFLSQYVGRHMIRRRTGAIVNMGSQAGAVALPGEGIYCLGKAAVSHMTKCFAVEWGQHNVRVNCVAPTFIRTDGTAAALSNPGFEAEVVERIAALHRIGEPREVAGAVVFLASDAASLITGQTLLVDGGWTAR